MNKLSITFDGNYFFYKTLFAFGTYSSNKKLLEDAKEQEMFVRKIATDVSHCIRTFGNPDKIVFTIDDSSWRKSIMIEDGGYKSNRDKDNSTIDWDAFYACMNEFAAILESKGFIISKEKTAEGDDLMFLWADAFYKDGIDNVIITGDKDASQCIKYNESNFVAVFNPNSKNRKIIAPTGFKDWLTDDTVDIFNASSFMNRSKDAINEILNSISIEEIDPVKLIFEKILTGDSGDTVPSVWTWMIKDKNYRITPKKANQIIDYVNAIKPLENVMNLIDRSEDVAKGILEICKEIAPADVIKDRLRRNIKLVYLDYAVIPQSIQNDFANSYEKHKNHNLSASTYDMVNLLKGSRFISQTKSIEADIFKLF